MTGFRHAGCLHAYSGGTVRDLHPIPYSLPGPIQTGQHSSCYSLPNKNIIAAALCQQKGLSRRREYDTIYRHNLYRHKLCTGMGSSYLRIPAVPSRRRRTEKAAVVIGAIREGSRIMASGAGTQNMPPQTLGAVGGLVVLFFTPQRVCPLPGHALWGFFLLE